MHKSGAIMAGDIAVKLKVFSDQMGIVKAL